MTDTTEPNKEAEEESYTDSVKDSEYTPNHSELHDSPHRHLLAHEITQTSLKKSLPVSSTSGYKREYAITPIGSKVANVQYIGKITSIEHNKKNGYEWLKMKSTDGRLPVTINISGNRSSLFEKVKSLSTPAYVAFSGYIQTWEFQGDTYSKLEAVSANQVNKKERIRFLKDAAESTLERINQATDDIQRVEQQHAIEEYGDLDLEDFADAAIKALEEADKELHSDDDLTY